MKGSRLALGAVLALAGLLRLWGLALGSPPRQPDEFNFVYWPLLFFAGGDLNPGFFYYPHLQYYLLALVYGAHFLWQRVFGAGWSLEEWAAYGYFWDNDTPLLLARLLSAGMALAAVWWAGEVARRAYGPWAGPAAALLLAVGVLHVRQSPLAAVDVPMTCWYLGALWAALRLFGQERPRDYALAAALVGLAGATKYQGALAGAAMLAAHLLAGRRLLDRRLWLAGLGALGVFLAASPYVALDFGAFRRGFAAVAEHTLQGRDDLGWGWWYHLHTSLRHNLGWPGLALLLLSLALACRRPRREVWVVLCAFAAYFLVIGAGRLVFVRYALPLAALQAVLVAGLLAELKNPRWRWLALGLVALAPLYHSARVAQLMAAADTRQEAGQWIEAQVPAGASLCNFGGWAGDPELDTVEELWRRTSYFVRQTGSSPEALMPFLDRTAPPSPWYSLAIQPGERQLDPGSRRAVEDHGCGYVLLNRHPLSTSRLDSAFLAELPALGERVARFGDPGGVGPAYDPLDAYFIPLGDFGELRQPGPEIEVWQLRGPPSSGSRLQSGRQRFAAAFMRAARSMLEEGKAGDFLELAGRACDLDPALADAPFHVLAGRACAQLGGYRAALDHCQQALALDPGNEGALQLRRLVEGR